MLVDRSAQPRELERLVESQPEQEPLPRPHVRIERLDLPRWKHTVREGEMPPLLYVLAHPAARLSDRDQAAVVDWARTLR